VTELRITCDGITRRFEPGAIVSIGRSPDNSIVVGDPRVADQQAYLVCGPGGWVLEDLGTDRLFMNGHPVKRVTVGTSAEFRLASPTGPSLRMEAADAPVTPDPPGVPPRPARPPLPPPAPPPAPVPPKMPGNTGGPAFPGVPRPTKDAQPGDGRLDPQASELATALHILIPLRSWLSDPGWRQGFRLLVIAYGLLPSVFNVLFLHSANVTTPGWAYSLYIAPLWAIAFWHLIRPGQLTRLVICAGAGIIVGVLVLLPILTLPWERTLDRTGDLHSLLPWIYGVGYAEEVTKALPVLVAALILLKWRKVKLDVRMWMFLGTIAGLTFGVAESVKYAAQYLTAGNHVNGVAIQVILLFAIRVFLDGFQHAVWAGISGFFIGMGVNYRRQRIPLIIIGISVPAILHGLNDWSTTLSDQWLWIGIGALSLVLFLGYTMSAAAIERQVRKTPMFRGESMLLDRSSIGDQG
jgi:RsiW-degrading membrane proteinase PrsW (M82 family)